MIWFWRLMADLGSWLLSAAVEHGAYQEDWSEEELEEQGFAEQRREREEYESAKAEGYWEGRRDERHGIG